MGVKVVNGQKHTFMVSNKTDLPTEIESVPLDQNLVYLKIECNFKDRLDMLTSITFESTIKLQNVNSIIYAIKKFNLLTLSIN